MEDIITYEVTFISTKERWIFQYRKSDEVLHCFLNLSGQGFFNLLDKNTFPRNVQMIEEWTKYKNIVNIELKLEDYSFESFYDKYGLKRKGDLARKAWDKLDLATKIKCFNQLPKYNADLAKTGQAKAHLVTWLNQKRYNDEY
ncbi:hypothetical protein [Flavobacterium sp. B183]|uniref:hypothetical protein n=1 Tax=Flavobacterium sp. B183 TaxID=907046 RepID=UPI00201F7694|nr:hypothetical protein [Flavobacterium sp. B183]URC13962.1 hypothetical protein M4I44_06070 [Flavobacterium sp. B183]URC14017.1 hypothetical protein M4I44_06410 [Flavobacterium sp. B183]